SLNTITVQALNSQAYTLSGNTLNVTYGITTASGSNDFIYNTNVTTCRTEGNGSITINSGITYTSGCDYINYNFSGDIHGSGTFVKEGVWNLTFYGTRTVDTAFVQAHGTTFTDWGANLTLNNTVTFNSGGIWNLGTLNVPNYPIDINADGLYQSPGPINAYGINFNGGSSNSYGTWNSNQTTITGSDLNLNGAKLGMTYFGVNPGDKRTLIETTNGYTISGEFSNLPSGSTAFFQNNADIIEVKINYFSTYVEAEMVSKVAGDCTWTGNNGNSWSDVGNWSGCSGAAPVNGKNLIFPSSASNYSMDNDISGLSLSNVAIATLNNSNYSLSGNNLTINSSIDFAGAGNNYFEFNNDITTYGLSGTGNLNFGSGNSITISGNTGNYTFAGNINGNGYINKSNGGTQTLNNVTVGTSTTINVNGYFLQLSGNTNIYGPLNNNSGGGLLYNQNSTINHNSLNQNGGNINLGPGVIANLENYNYTSGNFGADASGVNNYGKAVVTGNNNLDLNGKTASMRFFGSYNVGETYTILSSSGGNAQFSGQFSNLPAGSTIIAEGWGSSSIISDVEIKATYTSTSVTIEIVSIVPKTCNGDLFYRSNTGIVTSGSLDYLANSSCSWVIAPINADSVTLDFNTFDTESGNDIVKVYDGLTTDSPLLGEFSGGNLPGSLTANSGVMTVIFTSNATIQATGFNASWTTNLLPGPAISTVSPISGPISGGTNVTLNGSSFVSGQYQNIKSVGSTGYDGIRGMVVDGTGQYISGEFSGTITLGSTTLTSSGNQDIYVAKIDSNGNYIWAVQAGGSSNDGFHRRQSMATDNADGTILISGYYSGTATFGNTTLTGGSGANVFIAKLNKTTGNFIWVKSAGGNTSILFANGGFPVQYGSAMDVDSSGNIYLTGRITGSNPAFDGVNLTLNNSINGDLFVAKLNSSGVVQWVKNYGDTGSNSIIFTFPTGVKVDASGNVYVVTGYHTSINIGGTNLVANTAATVGVGVFKLNNSGNNLWAQSVGSTSPIVGSFDLPYGLALDSNQNIYITGYFGAPTASFGSLNVTGSPTGTSVFTAKLNGSGAFQWVKTLSTPQDFTTARDIFIDSNDKIWIAGAYDDVLSDGSKTISGNSTNAFFAQYDTSGNLVQLQGIGGTGGQLAINGVGGNQVRAIYEYNGKLYIAGEYFDTIGIGGKTITSAGNQDGFYTTWVIDKTSVKIDGTEVIANYISPTQLTFTTPAKTKGFKDVVVTNSGGYSFNLTGGYEYQAPQIQNSNISSMVCSPSPTTANTTVSCIITTTIDQNSLSGSIKVRIGASGIVTNCPVGASGTTITCNNVAVGASAGTFASQYNASGSGSTYANGNNIRVLQPYATLSPIVGPVAGGTAVTATLQDGTFADGASIVSIASGYSHTCALLSTGNVRCWGYNTEGELGYGNINNIGDDELPNSVGDVNVGGTVTQIAAGASHTCALLSTGNVRCWGYNGSGQLGYGNINTIGDDELPNSVGDVNVGGSVTQIVAGGSHTCALLSSGNVRCWGDNGYGQLGYGNINNIGDDELPNSVGDVNIGGTATQISAGDSHTCALLSTGNLRCWGYNGNGELGYGNINNIGDDELPNSVGDVNVGGTVIQISTGSGHNCVLLSTGNVRCWGYNGSGQLGYGNINTIGDDELPNSVGDVNVGGSVTQIVAGGSHTCALLSSGNVRCWGDSTFGQLGYGNTNNIGDDELPNSAGDVNVGGTVTQISASGHTCALLSTGNVRCWGYNGSGELGYGNTNNIGDDELPYTAGDVNAVTAGTMQLTFDGIAATSITLVNPTTITGITPAHAVGPVNVVIIDGANNTYTLTGGFTYQANNSNPPIQNSDISSITCTPTSTAIATTTNCTVTTSVNLNTLSGSVNLRIGTGGNIISCPVTGSGTTLTCNNIPVGAVVGGFYSQYAASGSGSSYSNGNQITVTSTGTCSVNTAGGGASTTFAGLCVSTGSLTLYPGDSIADNDLCSSGDTGTYQFVRDDGILTDPITCSPAEQSLTYQAINISPNRQSINTTINDILFEDLTGSSLNAYSVSATFGNFINQGTGRNIALGANPDEKGEEGNEDIDAPTSTDSGKLYCAINPQAAGSKVTGINPGAARASNNQQKLVKGSKTTITSNQASVNLFSTGGLQVLPGRYDIDGVTSKCRIPAYSSNGNYSQTIYFTVVAS
ncbi:MAG: CUB domain-containing protein, partial [bacterium]